MIICRIKHTGEVFFSSSNLGIASAIKNRHAPDFSLNTFVDYYIDKIKADTGVEIEVRRDTTAETRAAILVERMFSLGVADNKVPPIGA